MAYIIDGDRPLIFVANPRTGSTAVANALKTMGAQITGGSHHSQPFYIPPGAIVFQVVRNHFEVLNSFWWKSKPTGNFEGFIELALTGNYDYVRVPCMYYRIGMTHTIQYDDLDSGFEWMCRSAGLNPPKLERTSTRTQKTSHEMFSPHVAQSVYEVFQEEMTKFGYSNLP